jgi:hypothetical protein
MGVEIRKHQDIEGVVTTEDVKEGRMVLLTSHDQSLNWGSREDLPGVKLPDNSTEAGRALYCLAFSVDNSQLPIYEPQPSLTQGSQRGGWNQDANVPFSADVYLTHPGNMKGQTIPSGSLALALAGGIYTVYSGGYIHNANLAPGARLEVANASDDGASEAGKLQYTASGGIATVWEYSQSDGELTFKADRP